MELGPRSTGHSGESVGGRCVRHGSRMPRKKTRVSKIDGKWLIVKPKYGFHVGDEYEYYGPFDSHREAIRVANAEHPVSTISICDRAHTPSSYWWPEIWSPIIR